MFVNKKRDVKRTRTELSGRSDQSAQSSRRPGQAAEVTKINQSPKLPGPLTGQIEEVPQVPGSSSRPSSIAPTTGNFTSIPGVQSPKLPRGNPQSASGSFTPRRFSPNHLPGSYTPTSGSSSGVLTDCFIITLIIKCCGLQWFLILNFKWVVLFKTL